MAHTTTGIPAKCSAMSAGRSSTIASPCTMVTFLNSASVSARMGGSRSSSSIATTFSARRHSSAVSTPKPGPISSTPTPGAAPPSSAILGHTPGLMIKFCPSAREKENPWRCSSSLMTAGSVSVGMAASLRGDFSLFSISFFGKKCNTAPPICKGRYTESISHFPPGFPHLRGGKAQICVKIVTIKGFWRKYPTKWVWKIVPPAGKALKHLVMIPKCQPPLSPKFYPYF